MPEPETDSQALVQRIQAGDQPALAELIERHLPALRAFVRLRLGAQLRAKESTSDIVQSACRDVLGNLGQFRYGGEAGFKAWLFETTARKIADRAEYWRAGRRDVGREAPQPASSAPSVADDARLTELYRAVCSPSQAAIGREALERIERAFERIEPDQREIIVMARLLGLPHAEIARKLDCTPGAARVRLFRALADLASALKEDEGADPRKPAKG